MPRPSGRGRQRRRQGGVGCGWTEGPLRRATEADLDGWARSGKPVTVLVPEYDDYLPPERAVPAFAPLTGARVIAVDGAKHLWVGEKYVRIVLDHIVEAVTPGAGPLPTTVPTEFVSALGGLS